MVTRVTNKIKMVTKLTGKALVKKIIRVTEVTEVTLVTRVTLVTHMANKGT